MNSHCSGTGRSLWGPWEGPVPPKSGCVHINLGFPHDAAVTFLGHSLHAASPSYLLALWLSAQLPPGREDVPVTRSPVISGDALGKHLEGVGSAGLDLVPPHPEGHNSRWALI